MRDLLDDSDFLDAFLFTASLDTFGVWLHTALLAWASGADAPPIAGRSGDADGASADAYALEEVPICVMQMNEGREWCHTGHSNPIIPMYDVITYHGECQCESHQECD